MAKGRIQKYDKGAAAGGVDRGKRGEGVLGDSSEETVGVDGGDTGVAWLGGAVLGGGSGEKGLFESIDDQTGPLASVRHPLTRLPRAHPHPGR